MNFRYLFLLLFSMVFITSCTAQENKHTTLEGKWKVIDWTYISFAGRGFDKRERKGMNKDVNGLILDFRSNQTLSSNKPGIFKFLENKKFTISRSNDIVVNNQHYPFFVRDGKHFLLLSNVALQIKKIEGYANAKIKFRKLAFKNAVTPVLKNKTVAGKVYTMEALDKPPKLKGVEFDKNCLIDCLYNAFNSTMTYFIDYSKVGEDTSFFLRFVIDKAGKIRNIRIKSRHNKPLDNVKKSARLIVQSLENEPAQTEKVQLSEAEKSIVLSILSFQDGLVAGIKNGQRVDTKLNLELRLISN